MEETILLTVRVLCDKYVIKTFENHLKGCGLFVYLFTLICVPKLSLCLPSFNPLKPPVSSISSERLKEPQNELNIFLIVQRQPRLPVKQFYLSICPYHTFVFTRSKLIHKASLVANRKDFIVSVEKL